MLIIDLVAENLRFFRERAGLSAIDLARNCGLEKQTVYQIEDRTNWISLKTLQKICTELGIEQHELFQIGKRSTNN